MNMKKQQESKKEKTEKNTKKKPKAKFTYSSPTDPLIKRLLISSVEFATGRFQFEKMYNEMLDMNLQPIEQWSVVIEKLGVDIKYDSHQIDKIPTTGPLVYVANHPFGVLDGLIFGHLVAKTRKEFKIVVNEVLCRYGLFENYLLPVDFRETKAAMQTNLETRKKTLAALKAGQAIAIFPSGGVATAPGYRNKKAIDLEWKRFVAQMIQKTKATVVPLYFHGQNSRIFHIVSQFSSVLRLSLLLQEVRNKLKDTIEVSIGDPIPYENLAHIKNRQDMIDHLRDITHSLQDEKINV